MRSFAPSVILELMSLAFCYISSPVLLVDSPMSRMVWLVSSDCANVEKVKVDKVSNTVPRKTAVVATAGGIMRNNLLCTIVCKNK